MANSDWLKAMCEIVISSEWHDNMEYDFCIHVKEKLGSHAMTTYTNDDDINFRRNMNVKQHKWLPQIIMYIHLQSFVVCFLRFFLN